jgi:hypothetical protein
LFSVSHKGEGRGRGGKRERKKKGHEEWGRENTFPHQKYFIFCWPETGKIKIF